MTEEKWIRLMNVNIWGSHPYGQFDLVQTGGPYVYPSQEGTKYYEVHHQGLVGSRPKDLLKHL